MSDYNSQWGYSPFVPNFLEDIMGMGNWGSNIDGGYVNNGQSTPVSNTALKSAGVDNSNGWGSLGTWGNAADMFKNIAGAWLGYENLQQNKEKFDASKDMWNANYAANRQTTNNRIIDQATSRLGATGGMAADSMSHVKSNKLIGEVTV